jgi:uncharacterized protein
VSIAAHKQSKPAAASISRRDWALLALAASPDKALSPVQIQKTLFLFKKQSPVKPQAFYNFKPYNYGPFDVNVYGDLQTLEFEGLVDRAQSSRGRFTEYKLTIKGLDQAKQLRKHASGDALSCLHKVADKTRAMSFSELVRAIYREYPEYKKNSVFRT